MQEKVLVAYASRFGSTKGIAERIGEVLTGAGLTVEVRAADEVDVVDGYRAFIVGSTVEGGHWLTGASALLERHAAALGDGGWVVGQRHGHRRRERHAGGPEVERGA